MAYRDQLLTPFIRSKKITAVEATQLSRDLPTVPEYRDAFLTAADEMLIRYSEQSRELAAASAGRSLKSRSQTELNHIRELAKAASDTAQVIDLLIEEAGGCSRQGIQKFGLEGSIYGNMIEPLVKHKLGQDVGMLYSADLRDLNSDVSYDLVWKHLPKRTKARFLTQEAG